MDRIQLRRDTSANWAEVNPILLEGEVGFETDTKLRKIGDGVNRWNDLEYLKAEGISQETGNSQNITMSQDAITRELSKLGSEMDNETNLLERKISILDVSTKEVLSAEDTHNIADSTSYAKYFMTKVVNGYKVGDMVKVVYESNIDISIIPCIFGTGTSVTKKYDAISLKAGTRNEFFMQYEGDDENSRLFGGYTYKEPECSIKVSVYVYNVDSRILNEINETLKTNTSNIDLLNDSLGLTVTLKHVTDADLIVDDSESSAKYFITDITNIVKSRNTYVTFTSNKSVVITPCIFGFQTKVVKKFDNIALIENHPMTILMPYDSEEDVTAKYFGGYAYKESGFNISIKVEERISSIKAIEELQPGKEDLFDNVYILKTNYGISNSGTSFSTTSRTAKIPIKPNTIYTWFNGVVSTTFKPLSFRSKQGVLGLSDGCIIPPTVGDLDFNIVSTKATYYTERVYFKTSSDAEYVEITITDEMMDVNNMHLYEGVRFQNPSNYPLYNNKKINALVIGDSYWDRQSADYYGSSLANQIRDLIGINYIMNFAQGGGRLIHSVDTVDITNYNETYANGSVQNVYSNQFLKYKMRHEEDSVNYPIPDLIIIGGFVNNTQFYEAGKFDIENFDAVFTSDSNLQDETLFSGAFKRLIKLIYETCGDVPIIHIGSSGGVTNKYKCAEMERISEIACKCFAVNYISYMEGGGRFYAQEDYTDGVHPTEKSAIKMAKYIAKQIINNVVF